MKKFLLILSCCAGLTFCSGAAEAANFSFSVGGFAPPVVVMDTGYYSPYYSYSIPYYSGGYFYVGSRHHHGHVAPPPRHMHSHRLPHGGVHRAPHGPGPKHK